MEQAMNAVVNTVVNKPLEVKIKRLTWEAKIPQYATKGAACFDIYTTTDGVVGGVGYVFGTGLSFEVPEGYVLLVYSRSGHGFKHNVRLANCVGVIDSDYRGELKVKLTSDTLEYIVKAGDAIAQGMLVKIDQVQFAVTETLSDTERGANGFGSTGK